MLSKSDRPADYNQTDMLEGANSCARLQPRIRVPQVKLSRIDRPIFEKCVKAIDPDSLRCHLFKLMKI